MLSESRLPSLSVNELHSAIHTQNRTHTHIHTYIEASHIENLVLLKTAGLAKELYFEQFDFLAFLKYLEYWKRPEYIKCLSFPQCLTFLDYILSSPAFRKKLKDPVAVAALKHQQSCAWIYAGRGPADFAVFE